MTDSEHTVNVEGWPLVIRTINNQPEPTILDEDLAEKLGYERPRVIRDLIKRYVESGKLPGINVRRTVRRTSMPHGGTRQTEVDAYFLNEEEALYITAKSETPEADAMLKEVIHVFTLARRGLLPDQQLMQQALVSLAALPAQMAQQHTEVMALIQTIGQPIKTKLDSSTVASLRDALGDFAKGRGITKREAWKVVRREMHIRAWADMSETRAREVREWLLQDPDRVIQEALTSKPPSDVGPSVDHAVTAIENSPFVRWQNKTYNDIPVKEAREPFFSLSDLIAEVRQRLRANKCSDQLPEIWVRGQIEDLGLAGPRWVKDGKYSADAVDWIFHRAHKRHAKEMGARAPWAGQ